MSKQLTVNGVKMERIDFDQENTWTIIKLSDGTELKIRVRVNWVMRLVDQWDENGEPRYNVNMATDMRFSSVPEELSKPAGITPESVVEFKGKMDTNLKGKAN